MQYYVYRWFNTKTNYTFYIGKGCKNRYKQTTKRNKLFNNYMNNNACTSEIIKYFKTEQEAFDYEREKILEYKNNGECICNLDNGGNGGCNFVWTVEMRKYKSKYNPMKNQFQRERMSKFNPMKDPNISKIVREKNCKKVILGHKMYNSIRDLAKEYNIGDTAIQYWLKRGYGKNNEPCYYYGTSPKKYTIKTHETSNKPIYIDGIYFKNVKSGAKYIGVWSESIIRAIKNNKLCKGHKCEYVNQQPSHMNSDKSSMEGSTTNE